MAKKQLEDDLLTGGSLNADDKSAKKAAKAKKSAEKKAAKAAKNREKNEAKRAEIKKEIDALKAKKDDCDDEKEIEKLSGEIKKLSEKYSAVGANSNGLAPKTVKIIKSAVCIVIVVALLVTYVATGAVRKGFIASLSIPAQTFTGMTVSNKDGSEKAKIKVATYNYYFALTYNNLRTRQQQYSQYGLDPKQYNLDVDFDKKLSKQTTKNDDNETVTWEEYIHDEVIESIESTYTYYLAAKAANNGKDPEITAEQKKELKETLQQYRESAHKYGYTLSGYLVKAMGKGVTESLFTQEATRSYIADNYKSELSDKSNEKEYTTKDYDNYKKNHEDELLSVDVRLFECSSEDDAKAFKKALAKDASNFTALCQKYASDKFYKTAYEDAGYSTEYGVTKENLKNKGYAIATADDKNKKSFPGLDWLYSSKRKAGDSYQYSTTVVYVLSPASIQNRKTVNVRHILIAPETSDNKTAAKDATDKQWSAAYKKATKILDEFNAGDKKEKSFAQLAKNNTSDTGSKDNGGLYENVVPGQMVNSFSAWIFDSSRKAGDTAIVKSDYGYHIMCFVGNGDLTTWQYAAKKALSSGDSTSKTEKLEKDYSIKVNWFGSRYFEKDVDIDN